MNTPVVLTIFNRPADVRRVFDAIRSARPRQLFVIGDAPRNERDVAGIEACKKIIDEVDWECDVLKNYAAQNMGPKLRLSSGISWVFEQVDRAIILEHDCLPDPTFFTFCEELLERYKDDERVMHIGGTNFHQENPSFYCSDSYYFSEIPLVWGFATWRRAWKHYDPELGLWPLAKKEHWLSRVFSGAALDRWEYRFEQYSKKEINSWDGQWTFACIINHGLCINPAVNLITNIGFGPLAFTTKGGNGKLGNLPLAAMPMPLKHPEAFLPYRSAQAYIDVLIFDINRTLAQRVQWFFKSRFPNVYAKLKSLVKTSS